MPGTIRLALIHAFGQFRRRRASRVKHGTLDGHEQPRRPFVRANGNLLRKPERFSTVLTLIKARLIWR